MSALKKKMRGTHGLSQHRPRPSTTTHNTVPTPGMLVCLRHPQGETGQAGTKERQPNSYLLISDALEFS